MRVTYENNRFPLLDHATTIEAVRTAVSRREPFSLIRIGDGEAVALSIDDGSWLYDLEYLHSHWGAERVALADALSVKSDLAAAARGADIVGVRDDIVDATCRRDCSISRSSTSPPSFDPTFTSEAVNQADEVLMVAELRASALVAGEPDRIRRLLHPEFRWTSHNGERLDREGFVRVNTRELRWVKQRLEDPEVTVVDDTALLLCTTHDTVVRDGVEQTFIMPVTQVWVRSHKSWVCLAGHTGPAQG